MMSNSESGVIDERCDFGKLLSEARKAQNFTISEINEHIKISEHVISAIEASDIATLPAPTFTRGYIRAYAKFLEISEDNILDMYHRALPGKSASELKPRSNLSREAKNLSPLIKTVTVFLIIAGIAAVIYGSFQYYQKKMNVMETELESKEHSFTGSSLDSPTSQQAEAKQNTRLTEEGELVLEQAASSDSMVEADEINADTSPARITAAGQEKKFASVNGQNESDFESTEDVIEFFAEQGSWMEVRDANNARLFYNMLPEGGRRTFRGRAPFSVFMGNAETTKVEINNLEVDVSPYIRSNNTAKFKISSEQQKVIFH
ncbi:MAG: helix-turn-helix domain-containing protein [Gammaproteobacteria bacterium]